MRPDLGELRNHLAGASMGLALDLMRECLWHLAYFPEGQHTMILFCGLKVHNATHSLDKTRLY